MKTDQIELKKKRLFCFLLIVFVMFGIWSFSSQNSEESSGVSRGLTEQLIKPFMPIPPFTLEQREAVVSAIHGIVRKCAHFFLYALLGSLILQYVSLYKKDWRSIGWITFFSCAIYATGDECHQLFVQGRSGELRDVVLDVTGAVCGGWTAVLIQRIKKRGRK